MRRNPHCTKPSGAAAASDKGKTPAVTASDPKKAVTRSPQRAATLEQKPEAKRPASPASAQKDARPASSVQPKTEVKAANGPRPASPPPSPAKANAQLPPKALTKPTVKK